VEDADGALVDRWQGGDNVAGEELFKRYFDPVYNFFQTKCPPEADELTQRTFVECVSAKDRFRRHSTFRTFLFAIARHQLFGLLRSRSKRDVLDFEVSSIADLISTPGTRLARNQEHQHLVETMQQLPVEQQMLLELHYREELGIPELMEVFEVSSQVIRTRLHRARKALREKLATPVAGSDWASRLTSDPD
jgi:RNA polymerase sigma-70 factor (ECF subfamily)